MFNWTNTTLPKLMDYLNNTSRNPMQTFTAAWVSFLGGWFFAFVIGIIASAIYIKYQNVVVPIVFFAICTLLLGAVMPTELIYVVGVITAFAVGFLLYKLFVKEE